MTELVLGIDSSTQSTKAELRRLDSGELVASGSAPHPTTTPPVSEQAPDAWWDALVSATEELGERRGDVVAAAVAGQQHGLVLLDEAEQVIRPAKLWNDTTSAEQADRLVERLGRDRWATMTGSVPVASFTVTKLAWVADNEPQSLERAAAVMLPHDYLTWRLTGEHVTDRGDASGTGWFDPAVGEYRFDLLEAAAGAHAESLRLPRVLGPFEQTGTLTATAAEALGLPSGVIIGPGTGDNMAAALGLGLRSGETALSLGTSGTVYSVAKNPTQDASGAVAGFADASGQFLPLVCTLNATRVTDTVASWLGTDAAGLSELAMQATPIEDGPLLVPYFDGERTPDLPQASGVFSGLRTSTTREDLALAAHDGVVCGLLEGTEALAAAGVELGGRFHLIGGGARSPTYQQRVADLAGRDVVVHGDIESVATGAALQAAAVIDGSHADEIVDRWGLGVGSTVEPVDTDLGPVLRRRYSELAEVVYGRGP